MADLLSDADVGFGPKLMSDVDVGFTPQKTVPASEFGDLSAQPWAQGEQPSPTAQTPVTRIADAAVQGWKGTPALVTPKGEDLINQTGPVGQQLINPALKIAGVVPAAAHAGMAALSQAAMEVFGEKGGRDALALLSSLPMANGERMNAEPVRAAEAERPPSPYMTVERNPPVLDSVDRGAANQGFAAAGKDVMEAPDVDGAIVAASDAVRAPEAARAPADDVVPPQQSSAPIPTAETLARAASSGDVVNTSKAAKQIASAYYQRAEDVGGNLTPDFTNKFLDKADAMVPQTRAGKIVAGEGPTTSLIERIQELRDSPLSLREAQEIDEGLGNLIDGEFGIKGLSKEGHNLLELQTSFRDMIRNAGPEEIDGGTQGFDALVLARKAWSQAMKLDDLERIQNRADLQEVPSTGIRTGLRTLLSNPSRVRGYSAPEIAALRAAADRGFLGAALNVFGSRLIPVGLGAHGMATLNPVSLAAAGLGYGMSTLSRNAATALQTRRMGNAMDVVGQSVPPAPRGLLNSP